MRPVPNIFGGNQLAYESNNTRPDSMTYAEGPYVFGGWEPGHKPTETFDAGDWVGCLHGCCLALTLLNDPKRSHDAIEDGGVIHEITHMLHFGKDVNWLNMSVFRDELQRLQEDALKAYDQHKESTNHKLVHPPSFTEYINHPGEKQYFSIPARGPLEAPLKFYTTRKLEIAPEGPQEGAEGHQVKSAARREGVYSSFLVPEFMLWRSGKEEASDPANDGQAERPIDVRDGDAGQVSMLSLQQASKSIALRKYGRSETGGVVWEEVKK